jgi:hypothetical protein
MASEADFAPSHSYTKVGTVHDDNLAARWMLRRESILPSATDTAAAPSVIEATPSTVRLTGFRSKPTDPASTLL